MNRQRAKDVDDAMVIRLLNEHHPRGMELLFDTYYRPLVLWADNLLDNIPLAEDLVQDFLVTFWKEHLSRRLTTGNLKGYLFTSVKNLALNKRDKRDPLRNACAIREVVAELVEPEDFNEELLQKLEAEIEKLPPRTRQVVKAVYMEGLKYKEVALKLNVSVATVKTLLVHAIKRLRGVFGIKK